MLILDLSRTLDFMVARSERVIVPEPFTATREARPVAAYGPVEESAPLREADRAGSAAAPGSGSPVLPGRLVVQSADGR